MRKMSRQHGACRQRQRVVSWQLSSTTASGAIHTRTTPLHRTTTITRDDGILMTLLYFSLQIQRKIFTSSGKAPFFTIVILKCNKLKSNAVPPIQVATAGGSPHHHFQPTAAAAADTLFHPAAAAAAAAAAGGHEFWNAAAAAAAAARIAASSGTGGHQG